MWPAVSPLLNFKFFFYRLQNPSQRTYCTAYYIISNEEAALVQCLTPCTTSIDLSRASPTISHKNTHTHTHTHRQAGRLPGSNVVFTGQEKERRYINK